MPGTGWTSGQLTARANAKHAASPLSPTELERWLIETGFATVNGDGLEPTPLGRQVAAGFG